MLRIIALSRIRTGVVAATKRSTNHYTNSARLVWRRLIKYTLDFINGVIVFLSLSSNFSDNQSQCTTVAQKQFVEHSTRVNLT